MCNYLKWSLKFSMHGVHDCGLKRSTVAIAAVRGDLHGVEKRGNEYKGKVKDVY